MSLTKYFELRSAESLKTVLAKISVNQLKKGMPPIRQHAVIGITMGSLLQVQQVLPATCVVQDVYPLDETRVILNYLPQKTDARSRCLILNLVTMTTEVVFLGEFARYSDIIYIKGTNGELC